MINNFIKLYLKKKDNFRFPPDPNGFLHIGHIFSITLNNSLSKNYFGKFLLRFDNTNLKKFFFFYKKIKLDIIWLGIKWFNKNLFFFNNIKKYYSYLIFFFKKKISFYKIKNIIQRINYNYLLKRSLINILLFKNNFFKKYDISFFLKNKIIFRKKKFFRNWFIFPTYDFSQCINDLINKISISICTNEFKENSKIYYFILNKIIKFFPIQIEFEKKKVNNKKISKKKIKNFFFFIFYLRSLNINPKILLLFCNFIGITKNFFNIKLNNFFFFLKKEFLYTYKNKIKIILYICNNLKKNILKSFFFNKKNLNLKFFNSNLKIFFNLLFSFNKLYNLFFYNKKVFFLNNKKKKIYYIIIKKNIK